MTWWNDYVGIKFVDQGRDRSGCDCAGLVCLVYSEQLNRDIGAQFGFYDSNDASQTAELFADASKDWDQVTEPQDFDVVRLIVQNEPCHVGIVCNGGKSVLNVRKSTRAVIEPLDARPWNARIDSFWRYPA